MEEVQENPENPFFPKESTEYQTSAGKNPSLCEGMAELLWDSKYEEANRGDKRMAVPSDSNVRLETVEEAENEGEKSNKDGSTEGVGVSGGKQPPWILVHDAYSSGQYGNDKRKTDTSRLL